MTTVTSPWPGLGQPLFEMCWVYMAIAQIAQEPPPSVKRTNVEKKVFQTILASPYTPGQIYAKKMLQTIIASLYTSPILRKRGYILREGKLLFEMCWFYMGITQIA